MARYPADLASEFEDELEDELEDEFYGEFEDEFEAEAEDEFENEYEDELEDEDEGEEFLGGLTQALGGLLGQGEGEEEYESEDEDEAFLGGIAQLAGSLFGQGEGEFEDEDEAEEFFGRIGRALRQAAPFLKVLAKRVGPLVATAVGGPAAGALARAVTSQLEGEAESELEEMATAPVSPPQSMAEYFAARAAASESETEAEAFTGAASYLAISARDRRDLERMLPALLRGSAALTRILHPNRHTRQAVRLVPGIVGGAARTLARQIESGGQVGPVEVGQALGGVTARALGDPRSRSYIMRRHAHGLALARRRRARGSWGPGYDGRYRGYGRPGYGRPRYGHGYPYGRPRYGYGGYRQGRGSYQLPGRPGSELVRPPTHNRIVGARAPLTRPRPGFVRVVTPVRVPSRSGAPPRVVRVVSDVRVPRGAVAAGRPTAVRARR
jgi:hypothetical protein